LLSAIKFWYQKYGVPFKKIDDLDLTLTTPKVKLMYLLMLPPNYITFETFFRIYHNFQEILMHYLKCEKM